LKICNSFLKKMGKGNDLLFQNAFKIEYR